jgi:hypothetical protein
VYWALLAQTMRGSGQKADEPLSHVFLKNAVCISAQSSRIKGVFMSYILHACTGHDVSLNQLRLVHLAAPHDHLNDDAAFF